MPTDSTNMLYYGRLGLNIKHWEPNHQHTDHSSKIPSAQQSNKGAWRWRTLVERASDQGGPTLTQRTEAASVPLSQISHLCRSRSLSFCSPAAPDAQATTRALTRTRCPYPSAPLLILCVGPAYCPPDSDGCVTGDQHRELFGTICTFASRPHRVNSPCWRMRLPCRWTWWRRRVAILRLTWLCPYTPSFLSSRSSAICSCW